MDWEKIKKSLKEGVQLSVEKIDEYTKIGKLKIDELGAKRKIDKNFADIGERVFDLLESGQGDGIGADLAVGKSVENINELRREVSAINKKIDEIQQEAKSKNDACGEDLGEV